MLNPLLREIQEDVMGFLNEIQLKYPEAITFASGRPSELFFDVQDFPEYFNLFIDYLCDKEKKDKQAVLNSLGQYNRAKGIINDLVVDYFKKDEEISADPESVIMTVGTQEAMVISVMTLCDKANDVVIVEDPSYIGITHFSILAGYQVEAVPVDEFGISPDILEQKILYFQKLEKSVKIVYIIPDFQNPSGITMPVERREALLALADKYGFFILEDNAYGEFSYQGNKPATLKAMDTNKRVIYLRSFSKTIYPSLRLGAIVADQLINDRGSVVRLSDLMAIVKGYITVNTSSISQAVFGGILIKNNFSLKNLNQSKIDDLKEKRNQLLASLNEYIQQSENKWAKSISWNIPEGGFFLKINVPFKVDKDEIIRCVEKYKVIITPMSFFYLGKGGENEIRLAFSNVSKEEIITGVKRLSLYFQSKFDQ